MKSLMADLVQEQKAQKKKSKEELEKERLEQQQRMEEEARLEHLRHRAEERRKALPSMVMLTAGAIVSVAMLILHFSLKRMLQDCSLCK